MTRDVREHDFVRETEYQCRSRQHDEWWAQAVDDRLVCTGCGRCFHCADIGRCPGRRAA